MLLGLVSVAVLHLVRPRPAIHNSILLISSIIFFLYCVSSTLIAVVFGLWLTLVYFLAKYLERRTAKTGIVLTAYICGTVLLFIAFKLGIVRSGESRIFLDVAVPLGFSFVMFQSIGLLLDICNGDREKAPGFLEMVTSFSFFPTFAAGPFQTFDQFSSDRKDPWSGRMLYHGYCLCCLGLFKFAISGWLVNPRYFLNGIPLQFDNSPLHALNVLLLGSLFLYLNFSGYSDIAVGMARMLGIKTPPNFRFPFLATSMAEYWRRWHITLGEWFKRYVFFPLNYRLSHKFSHREAWVVPMSIFVTYFLIGLWHHLSAKYILWAFLNAVAVAFFMPNNRNRWIGIPLTFFVALTINALFLSKDIGTFFKIVTSLFDGGLNEGWFYIRNVRALAFAVFCFVFFWWAESIVDLLESAEEEELFLAVASSFTLSALSLFIAITVSLGRTEAIYMGF